MNTPHDDMPEHDPQLSALYRKTGNIEPPAALDEAVLANARRAVRQRRNRWMLPLSTAAVLVLGITVLLKLNSEWQPGPKLEDGAPTSTPDKEKLAEAPARMLAKKAAPAPSEPQPLTAQPAATIAEQPRRTARAKTEAAESQNIAADTAPMTNSTVHETEIREEAGSPVISGMAQAEQKILQPKPWIEKIRKLVEAKQPDEAKKELKAFRKHYPDYKLPDDLKALIP